MIWLNKPENPELTLLLTYFLVCRSQESNQSWLSPPSQLSMLYQLKDFLSCFMYKQKLSCAVTT